MNDKTIEAVAELLIEKGPDSPAQYRAIAEEIVAVVHQHDAEEGEEEAQSATLQSLKMEIIALCPRCLHNTPCRIHRALFEEAK